MTVALARQLMKLKLQENSKEISFALNGMEDGSRILYFYGMKAISVLQKDDLPGIAKRTKAEAIETMTEMLKMKIIHRVVRKKEPKGTDMIAHPDQSKFVCDDPAALYVFDLEEEFNKWQYIGGGVLILLALAGTMFPLWPVWMKVGVWYLSVTLLVVLMSIIVLHFVINLAITPFGYGDYYLFPYLLHDDPNRGFLDAFRPVWGKWENYKKSSKKKDESSSSSSSSPSPSTTSLSSSDSKKTE